MPRLILLNGPPGIGKSTIAQRYVDEHPFALCLDLDVLRGQLGGWRQDETRSGELARDLSIPMIRAHLGSGYDVVVPQFVALPAYLDRLTELGAMETVLMADRVEAERRFHARTGLHQRVAAEMVSEAGGYARQYDQLRTTLANREAIEILSVAGDVEGTYALFLQAVTRE
ncbi:MAG: AAA family ATPase [Mycobacteriales bacterium]